MNWLSAGCYKEHVSQSPPELQGLEGAFRDLLDSCFSINLHRLRGVRGLLSGWIEIGVPPGEHHRVQVRIDEDLCLLARLDWLRSFLHHTPPRSMVLQGEAPQVLLACALGLGTPEEAKDRLPTIQRPDAALALSLWLQLRAEMFDSASIRTAWRGQCFEVTLACTHDPDMAPWREAFGEWAVEEEPHRLLLRPGCLADPKAQDGQADL